MQRSYTNTKDAPRYIQKLTTTFKAPSYFKDSPTHAHIKTVIITNTNNIIPWFDIDPSEQFLVLPPFPKDLAPPFEPKHRHEHVYIQIGTKQCRAGDEIVSIIKQCNICKKKIIV